MSVPADAVHTHHNYAHCEHSLCQRGLLLLVAGYHHRHRPPALTSVKEQRQQGQHPAVAVAQAKLLQGPQAQSGRAAQYLAKACRWYAGQHRILLLPLHLRHHQHLRHRCCYEIATAAAAAAARLHPRSPSGAAVCGGGCAAYEPDAAPHDHGLVARQPRLVVQWLPLLQSNRFLGHQHFAWPQRYQRGLVVDAKSP